MSNVTDATLRTLRKEVKRLAGHPSDRVFLDQRLDRFEEWLKELERQKWEREAARGSGFVRCVSGAIASPPYDSRHRHG